MIKLTPFQWSSFNFFGFYCAYGVLLPFLPMWLKHHGYDAELIGTLIALGYLFRFAGAMFFSQRIRRPSQLIGVSRVLTWLTILTLIGVMLWVENVWLLLPLLALFHLFNGGAQPLPDTIASTWQQQVGLDYGKTRLFGSIAFVIGSVSAGYLVGWLGESAIVGIMTAWLVFLGLGQFARPRQGFSNPESQAQTSSVGYWTLFKQPETCKMLLAIALIQGSHAAYYSYSTIYWADNGISTQSASLLWGLSVVAEILFFFFSNRLFKAWRLSHLVIFSCAATMLRWALLASTTNGVGLVAMQLMHAFSYAMGHYAMIRYISTQPAEHIAKLQALYFGLASCMLMALFTFIAGVVYPISNEGSFWLMTVFALPALFIVPKRFDVKLQGSKDE